MALSNEKKKFLRQRGHLLKPVVTIGEKGLTKTVLAELNRALNDHELIKVKLRVAKRKAMQASACEAINAELVQSIGNIILIYREATKQNPKLSNLLR